MVTVMDIISISLENNKNIVLTLNWIALLAIVVIVVVISQLLKKIAHITSKKSVTVNEVTLGIGNSSVTLTYEQKDKEIAYKLWVELSTRKIGIPYDEENDVIIEVYNSWYEFFKIARDLMKEIPSNRIKYSKELIELTDRVLNDGLRPHLTIWQAKFRKWFDNKSEKSDSGQSPQELQRQYPDYENLLNNLKKTNSQMIEYKELMRKIAFDE